MNVPFPQFSYPNVNKSCSEGWMLHVQFPFDELSLHLLHYELVVLMVASTAI